MVVVPAFYLIAYIIRKMDKKFEQIYYSDDGYWRGKSAIQKLAKASNSSKEEAERWLMKQPLYQIYLPAPKYIPRPNASMSLFANQMISIRQTFSIYHMTSSKRKHTSMLQISLMLLVGTKDPIN